MRLSRTAVILGGLLVAGCQQPGEVQLQPDDTGTNLEVQPIVISDTNVVLSSVDSSGILPADQLGFKGFLIVNSVKLDAGHGLFSFAYSQVFMADTAVRPFGAMLGFTGVDLGVVLLNGNLMVRVPHKIIARRLADKDTVLVRGYEYFSDLSSSYQPDRLYQWHVNALTPTSSSFSVQSPDSLIVDYPPGGAVVARDKDLSLRWRGGRGNVSIVLGTYNPAAKKSTPLLEFKVKANSGRAVIPAKFLRQLPIDHYVFTFILSNRIVQDSGGKMLAQAAFVYNSYVELR